MTVCDSIQAMSRTCALADCDMKHYAHDLCSKHYNRQRRTGDVDTVRVGHRWTEIDPVERLWERSEWRGECLIYTEGRESRSGHVMMSHGGRQQGVHRVAYATTHGPIPAGVVIRHSCDTPRCINTDHLLAGTIADNNRDRDERGRHKALRGEENGFARLRESDIPDIRSRIAAGESTYALASAYGVHQGTIWNVKAGRTWKHVPNPNR